MISIRSAHAILWLYITQISALTIVTLVAQFTGISFKAYVLSCLLTSIAIGSPALPALARYIRSAPRRDSAALACLVLLSLACSVIALSFHRVGRVAVDEFYSTANPTFYIAHPDEPMGFQAQVFYSGGPPIVSVAVLTAGAFEYMQAALGDLLGISYLVVYYQLSAALAAALAPLAVFLLLSYFSRSTISALLGTIAVVCVEIAASESAVAPGGFAFIRIYEGKSVLIALIVPLFAALSIEFLRNPRFVSWLYLFSLNIAASGMSTTSFMILPLLGPMLFLAFVASVDREGRDAFSILRLAAWYLATYGGLAAYMLLVALTDSPAKVYPILTSYPATLEGYIRMFGPATGATPLLALLCCGLAFGLAQGRSRRLFGVWLVLAAIVLGNPISGSFLLKYFRGIYYRAFYILPFPISAGIAACNLYDRVPTGPEKRRRYPAALALLLAPIALTLLLPASIFRNPIYAPGGWSQHEEYLLARAVISAAPEGVMLAPYPISGAIRMLSPDYPQLIYREDMLSYFLGGQGRQEEADLRLNAAKFLTGDGRQVEAFLQLLDRYPEIRSIVFTKSFVRRNDPGVIDNLLRARGFEHQSNLAKFLVYWRP